MPRALQSVSPQRCRTKDLCLDLNPILGHQPLKQGHQVLASVLFVREEGPMTVPFGRSGEALPVAMEYFHWGITPTYLAHLFKAVFKQHHKA